MAVKRNGLGRNLSALLGASGSQALLTEKETTAPQRLLVSIGSLHQNRLKNKVYCNLCWFAK